MTEVASQLPLDLTTVQTVPVKRLRLAAPSHATSGPAVETVLMEPLRQATPNVAAFVEALTCHFATVDARVAALLRVIFPPEGAASPELMVANARLILRTAEAAGQLEMSVRQWPSLPVVLSRFLLASAERLCHPKEAALIEPFVRMLLDRLRPGEDNKMPSYLRLTCLDTLEMLGLFIRPSGSETLGECFNEALQLLYSLLQSDCPHERARVLDLLGAWGRPDYLHRGVNLSQVILWMVEDEDARVRGRAFACFLRWHARGIRLDEELYEYACQGAADEEEMVRCIAIKLIWTLVQVYPDSRRELPGQQEGVGEETEDGEEKAVRLVDDGFCRLCTAIHDPSVRVRALAASLFGSLHQVSQHILLMTLEKQVMTNLGNLRKKKPMQERAEWAAGRMWTPSGDAFADSLDDLALHTVGACGAVVAGLEDEFAVVRNAAIDSVCELASHCPPFAVACQDSLVVMLTDDLESIRLNAVHSLRKLATHCLLRPDQLDIILGALREGSGELRRALHELLSESRLAASECLVQLVFGLIKNMHQYGGHDRHSLFRCAAKVGARHPQFVNINLANLVSSHPYLVGMEPHQTDPNYVCVLLCVMNAARHEPSLQASFPQHVRSNYQYMKEAYPDLMPDRDIFEGHLRHLMPPEIEAEEETPAGPSSRAGRSDSALGQGRWGRAEPSASSSSTTAAAAAPTIIPGEPSDSEKENRPFSLLVQRISRLAHRRRSNVELLTSGATSVLEFFNQTVMRLRHLMQAPCLQIVQDLESVARLDPGLAPSALCLRDWCRAVLCLTRAGATVRDTEEAIQDTLRVEFLYTGLSACDNRLVRKLRSQLTKRLQQLRAGDLEASGPGAFQWQMPSLSSPVRRVVATFLDGPLTRQAGVNEDLEFTAPMSMALRVDARVEGMERPADHVEVWVRIADKRMIRWVPPSHHWHMHTPTAFELHTCVHLSSAYVWTEPADVSVCLNFVVEGRKLDLCDPLTVKIRPQAPMRL